MRKTKSIMMKVFYKLSCLRSQFNIEQRNDTENLQGFPGAGLDKSQNGDPSEVDPSEVVFQRFLGSSYITLIFTTLGGFQSASIDRYPPIS